MSTEYIALGFETCLNEEGIEATPAQIARMAKRFELGMSVMGEAAGVIEQTKSGAPQKSPEQLRIESWSGLFSASPAVLASASTSVPRRSSSIRR